MTEEEQARRLAALVGLSLPVNEEDYDAAQPVFPHYTVGPKAAQIILDALDMVAAP